MKNLHSLIHNLQPSEVEIIRTSLRSYYSKEEQDFKTLKLFDLLLKNRKEIPDANTCSQLIYNKPKDNTIDKLASRLKAKILDALILDVNMERKGLMDEADASVLKVKKKMMQFLFLYRSRGNHPLVYPLLDDVIAYSKNYEIYSMVIEGLKYKKYFKGYIRGLDDFNKLNEEIAFYEHCEKAVAKANDHYYRLIVRADLHGDINKAQLQRYLAASIRDIDKDYKFTNSGNIGYYLKLIELAYLHNAGDMEKARKVCYELLNILTNNKAVYRKQRVGIAYGNISQCDVFLGDYEKAVENAQAFVDHTSSKSVNYAIAKEQEFHALFYGRRLEEAEKVLQVLLGATASQQGDFRIAKFRLYNANVLFLKKSYKAALKELLQNAVMSKDKLAWEIAIRVLTIMTMIELDNLDEAEKQVDSLRKHMDRHDKRSEVLLRDKIILKLLQKQLKRGFRFGSPDADEIQMLGLLASGKKKYTWIPFGAELIPFHSWLMSKHGITEAVAK
jgi:hypothetical protein